MVGIKDIITLLEKWEPWKRIADAPDRVDELETRISALEARLQKPLRAPGEACPQCGAYEFRVTSSRPTQNKVFAPLGVLDRTYQCGECGFSETRTDT